MRCCDVAPCGVVVLIRVVWVVCKIMVGYWNSKLKHEE